MDPFNPMWLLLPAGVVAGLVLPRARRLARHFRAPTPEDMRQWYVYEATEADIADCLAIRAYLECTGREEELAAELAIRSLCEARLRWGPAGRKARRVTAFAIGMAMRDPTVRERLEELVEDAIANDELVT